MGFSCEEFEFVYFVDFGGIAVSAESVTSSHDCHRIVVPITKQAKEGRKKETFSSFPRCLAGLNLHPFSVESALNRHGHDYQTLLVPITNLPCYSLSSRT